MVSISLPLWLEPWASLVYSRPYYLLEVVWVPLVARYKLHVTEECEARATQHSLASLESPRPRASMRSTSSSTKASSVGRQGSRWCILPINRWVASDQLTPTGDSSVEDLVQAQRLREQGVPEDLLVPLVEVQPLIFRQAAYPLTTR